MFGTKEKINGLMKEVELLKSETKRLATIIDFLNLSTASSYPRFKKSKPKPVSDFDLDIPMGDDDDSGVIITEDSFGKKLDNLSKIIATKEDLHRIEQRLSGLDSLADIFTKLTK